MMEHDERPWGSYTVLAEGTAYKVKRISYQRHARPVEHWLVVGGAERATIDGDEFDVVSGTAVDVPIEAAHRVAKTGTAKPLVLIEVQRGDHLGEDDIVRLEDDFGRPIAPAESAFGPDSHG
jgi:mannose-6-phosphate isomerase